MQFASIGRAQPVVGNTEPICEIYDTGRVRVRRLVLLLVIAFGYTAVYALFFLTSPLGRFPVLDGLENANLAKQIATGSLPHEPFYRAMLYPAVLSLFLRVGFATTSLPSIAAILGCLFHLGSTFCVYQVGRRVWKREQAGVIAAALFGLNAVAIYFSAEMLDTTFALFLFLTGLNALHYALACGTGVVSGEGVINWKSARPIVIGTTALVLAMLARPHYAIVVFALPFIVAFLLWRKHRFMVQALASVGLVAGILLGLTGLIQRTLCGKFQIMPSQGGYSLWAGNRPGANGRYFQQQIHIPAGANENVENPARIEAERLYLQETRKQRADLETINRYWKKKTVDAIRGNPIAWLGLMARKAYYLVNDFEQYNNKTFTVQKDLSPVLRYNPLGWGVTLMICATGLVLFWPSRKLIEREKEKHRTTPDPDPAMTATGTGFLLLVAGCYSAGVILFFVSDRFRLPLLPFLCFFAGAWGCVPREPLLGAFRTRGALVAATAGLTGLLTFSRAWGVHDLTPAVQDCILLSIASEKCGQDMDALRWARQALARRPDHPDALACAVTSFYNAKLQGAAPEKEFPHENWEVQAERVTQIPQPAPGVRLVQGVALWKLGRVAEAKTVLSSLMVEGDSSDSAARSSSGTQDDSLGVLLLASMDDAQLDELAKHRLTHTQSFYLLVGAERRKSEFVVPELQKNFALQAEPFVRNIFP